MSGDINIDEKYTTNGTDYFIRTPSGQLISVTREAWEENKAADIAVEASEIYKNAHGPANPVRGREVDPTHIHPLAPDVPPV